MSFREALRSSRYGPSNVDVVVVGAGPTALTTAAYLALLRIPCRVIDKRGSPLLAGNADGLLPRTQEILEALGVLGRAHALGAIEFGEWATWGPHETGRGITRIESNFSPPTNELTRHAPRALQQSAIERVLRDKMDEENGLRVEYGVIPVDLEVDASQIDLDNAYPVRLTLQHLYESEAPLELERSYSADATGKLPDEAISEGLPARHTDAEVIEKVKRRKPTEEIIRAKYVVAADGAHSWMRKRLGIAMTGDQTDLMWGVIDIVPITDFPDIRKVCTIHSSHGSCLVVHRREKLVRFYTQLQGNVPETVGQSGGLRGITPASILDHVRNILHPYKLDYRYCHWWSVYQAGQRLSLSYSDVHRRIFLAGDAVHNHSAKAGQGMNTGIADGFNLAWKLAGVLQGRFKEHILKTYESERRPVAQHLIQFDRQMMEGYKDQSRTEHVTAFMRANALFIMGIGIIYGPSTVASSRPQPLQIWDVIDRPDDAALAQTPSDLSVKDVFAYDPQSGYNPVKSKDSLAKKLPVGFRIPDPEILEHSSARRVFLHSLLPANGIWRILVFAGNVRDVKQRQKVNRLGQALRRPRGILDRYNPPGSLNIPPPTLHPFEQSEVPHLDAAYPTLRSVYLSHPAHARRVEVYIIHSASRHDVELADFDETFFPFDERDGYAYHRIYTDEAVAGRGSGSYARLGIDRETGAVLVVRPDQHVGLVTSLEDNDDIEAFFEGFMRDYAAPDEDTARAEVKAKL